MRLASLRPQQVVSFLTEFRVALSSHGPCAGLLFTSLGLPRSPVFSVVPGSLNRWAEAREKILAEPGSRVAQESPGHSHPNFRVRKMQSRITDVDTA